MFLVEDITSDKDITYRLIRPATAETPKLLTRISHDIAIVPAMGVVAWIIAGGPDLLAMRKAIRKLEELDEKVRLCAAARVRRQRGRGRPVFPRGARGG